MTDILYSYEQQLYDRRFMNCAERHAIVFLKERRSEVDWLFYRALVSTDEIWAQIIQQKKPKYNFVSGCFSTQDFAALGIACHELRSDRYAAVKTDVDKLIHQQGFVLISGSVFYFDHCPEFRKKHLHHLVVLCGVDEGGQRYDMVDDNMASVMCRYQYNTRQVADFYENNGDRLVRYFTLDSFDVVQSRDYFKSAFSVYLKNFQDSQRFFTDIIPFLENAFETMDNKLHLLHDSFSVLSGSRHLFSHYLSSLQYKSDWVNDARELGKAAFVLKSLMVKAGITKRIDIDDIATRIEQLRQNEQALLQKLTAIL
ncbi:hypothetical protein Dd1591_3651 [Dickeya chrysanthemi Ech1591]|uniref:Butirosin biosynthesis protein H N-terminal domain-containing protein n=1 Tax=Dickeya chrysanthemi (strain Ech1591) TaxID=561229 RepID=C6CLF6_DICC1|nr:hypothetical protein [Dickeya chrysanthemi]ACT08459.1 hypothetical protein Dd1591_3651 [Dickeya chrysanthemi Ech1591]